jgi:hypothetical protein
VRGLEAEVCVMKCPACLAENSVKWKPPTYMCTQCNYELARYDYRKLLEVDLSEWLASPPEDEESTSDLAP